MPSKDGRTHAHAPSLRDVFDRSSSAAPPLRIDDARSIYATGDADDSMYLIESGQVKVSMSSAGGKDCLVAVYTSGDVFGESCFVGPKRVETAETMAMTFVRRVAKSEFVAAVRAANLFEVLLHHVAVRMVERQTAVFELVTMDAEKRLAKVLLGLAEKLGTRDGEHLLLEQHISQEELSQMVGTTRPRVTSFIKTFKALGLVQVGARRAMKVHVGKMLEFLEGTDAD